MSGNVVLPGMYVEAAIDQDKHSKVAYLWFIKGLWM